MLLEHYLCTSTTPKSKVYTHIPEGIILHMYDFTYVCKQFIILPTIWQQIHKT